MRISEGFLYLSAFLRQLFCRLKIYQCQKQTPPPPSQKHHDPEFYLERQESRVSPGCISQEGTCNLSCAGNQAQGTATVTAACITSCSIWIPRGFYPYGRNAIQHGRGQRRGNQPALVRAGLIPAWVEGETLPGAVLKVREGRVWVNCGTLISRESWREPARHSGSHNPLTLQLLTLI